MKLNTLKNAYLQTNVSDDAVVAGWQTLSGQLGRQQLTYQALALRSVISIVIFCIATVSVYAASQQALPGDTLYGLKAVTDTAAAKITGRYDTLVEKRADDIVEALKKSSQQVEKAVEEYKKTVSESQAQVTSQQQFQQLHTAVEKTEESVKQFQNSTAATPSANQQEKKESTSKKIKKEKKAVLSATDKKKKEVSLSITPTPKQKDEKKNEWEKSKKEENTSKQKYWHYKN
jgi:hypothetical protein